MAKKLKIEILELEALAPILGKQYGTLRLNVAEKVKKNEPLEFGENGRYKLFGKPNKVWYAYDSEKYDISVISAPPKETEAEPESTPRGFHSTGVRTPEFNPKRPGAGGKKRKR